MNKHCAGVAAPLAPRVRGGSEDGAETHLGVSVHGASLSCREATVLIAPSIAVRGEKVNYA